jgi:hypothetical protein
MSEQKMEHVNPTGDLLAEAARPADSVAVEAHRRGDGREAMSVENPWREFIENCINGSNYFRAREYMKLLADLDRGYAAEMEVERLRSRLAETEALRKDAERYRWLRIPENGVSVTIADKDDPETWYEYDSLRLDAAIDAAMGESHE